MRRSLALILATTLLTTAAGCNSSDEPCGPEAVVVDASAVPTAVSTDFASRYPSASGVVWEREADSTLEASFMLGSVDMSAQYEPTGTLLVVETTIATTALPATVLQAMATSYPEYTLTAAASILDKVTNVTTYEAEATRGSKTWDFLFDASGTYLSKAEVCD